MNVQERMDPFSQSLVGVGVFGKYKIPGQKMTLKSTEGAGY